MFDRSTAEGTVLMYFDIGVLADMKILDACAASIFTVTEFVCVCVCVCVFVWEKTGSLTWCQNPEDVHLVDCSACMSTHTALLLDEYGHFAA